MDIFKGFTIFSFEYILRIYYLITDSINKDISLCQKRKESEILTSDEIQNFNFYQQSLYILTESTFLQMYAQLEETLYHESEKKLIGEKSSILRFEKALKNRGYDINCDFWKALINISKIRNCLLHSNGRLDIDRQREDTIKNIKLINNDAKSEVLQIIDFKHHKPGTSKIIIQEGFLEYCFIIIKNFINSQS